jgi:hypothetical protein
VEFPDFGLVKLSARDLTGPGVELWARRIAGSDAGSASFGVTLTADQLNAERLYMLSWSFSLIPGLARAANRARWYLQLGNSDIQLWGMPNLGFDGAVAVRNDHSSPFIVIPGGKALLFVVDFSSGGVVNTLDGWLWGYSFPKGNVLSF